MQLRKAGWLLRTLVVAPLYGSLGFGSYIGPTLLVTGRRRMRIGRRVRILPGMFAEAIGEGRINIEDDVAIGQFFHVTALGELTLGAGSTILGSVTITDIDHSYSIRDVPVHAQQLDHAPTRIGKYCFIGMGARILAGSVLGDGCVVGANSVVRGEFPANSVVVGSPARAVRQFNAESSSWDRITD